MLLYKHVVIYVVFSALYRTVHKNATIKIKYQCISGTQVSL